MTEPVRLVEGEGTAFERELLGSVLHEPVPEQLQARMALGLGLAPMLPPDGGLAPMLGSAAKSQVATGLGWFKLTALSLGLCASGAVGVGVWHAASSDQPSAFDATNATQTREIAAPPGANESLPSPAMAAEPSPQLEGKPTSGPVVTKVNTRAERGGGPARAPTRRAAAASESPGAAAGSAAAGKYVEQELRLLDPARAALERGDTKTASRLLNEYDQRFARGVLRREANVLRGQLQTK